MNPLWRAAHAIPLQVIGINGPQRMDVWKLLAGILNLGNTAVTEADTVEGIKVCSCSALLSLVARMPVLLLYPQSDASKQQKGKCLKQKFKNF